MKDHQIRELVNELRDIAVEYHGTQQLRERIARTVRAATFAPKGEAAPLLNTESKNTDSMPRGNEPVSQPYKLPATRFQQVADLYGITSPTGSETSFTFDAFEASSFAKSGWSVQEYVELERYQQAVTGNSPVIPDGWVKCSERMPERFVDVIASDGKQTFCAHIVEDEWWCVVSEAAEEPGVVTHWMPLPAAPQQEGR
jgi:hypothetical protein